MEDVIRLSVSESAKLFGVDQKTIRRAIKDGTLRYIVVRGRYKITFENLLKWSQSRRTVNNKLSTRGVGKFVEKWKINNKLYSPNPEILKKPEAKE